MNETPDARAEQDAGFDLSKYLTRASDVTPKKPQWLDTPMGPGWVVKSGLTMLAGMQGLGKSHLAVGIAATVSQKSNVLVFASEDDRETTLRPRLEAAGADLDRVHLFDVMQDFALPSSVTLLHRLVTETKTRLVVFDPIIAYVDDGSNSWKDQDVRRVQRVLGGIAMDRKFAALGVIHPPKGDHREPLHGIAGGSIAWTAGPRSVLGIAKVDEDLHLIHAKCNVAKKQPSRIVTLREVKVGSLTSTVLDIGPESDVTVDNLADRRSTRESPVLDQARAFLLANVPPEGIPVADIYDRAYGEGISNAAIKRAKMATPEIASYGEPAPDATRGMRYLWKRVPMPTI